MEKYPAGYRGRNMMRGRNGISGGSGNLNSGMASSCPDRCENKSLGMNPYEPIEHLPIAMAYVPYQKYAATFDLEYALKVGTLFPELCKPFCGKGACRS